MRVMTRVAGFLSAFAILGVAPCAVASLTPVPADGGPPLPTSAAIRDHKLYMYPGETALVFLWPDRPDRLATSGPPARSRNRRPEPQVWNIGMVATGDAARTARLGAGQARFSLVRSAPRGPMRLRVESEVPPSLYARITAPLMAPETMPQPLTYELCPALSPGRSTEIPLPHNVVVLEVDHFNQDIPSRGEC